jgi:hypothetical protein
VKGACGKRPQGRGDREAGGFDSLAAFAFATYEFAARKPLFGIFLSVGRFPLRPSHHDSADTSDFGIGNAANPSHTPVSCLP